MKQTGGQETGGFLNIAGFALLNKSADILGQGGPPEAILKKMDSSSNTWVPGAGKGVNMLQNLFTEGLRYIEFTRGTFRMDSGVSVGQLEFGLDIPLYGPDD